MKGISHMDNEWEQEVYIDPSVEEVRQQQRVMGGRWEAARKREIVLVVGIVLAFIARFLKLYLDADVLFTNIVFFLNVAGLVLYIIDLAMLIKMAGGAEKIFLILNWLFLRPFYFVRRAGVLREEGAVERGVVYGSVYFLAWVIYFGAYVQLDVFEMITLVSCCSLIVLWVIYAFQKSPGRLFEEVQLPSQVKEILSSDLGFRKLDEQEKEQYKSSSWKYGIGIYLFMILCMVVMTMADARLMMIPVLLFEFAMVVLWIRDIKEFIYFNIREANVIFVCFYMVAMFMANTGSEVILVWLLLFGLAIAVLVIRDMNRVSSKKELYVVKAYCIYRVYGKNDASATLVYYNFLTAQYEVGKMRISFSARRKKVSAGCILEVLVAQKKNKLKLIDVV